MAIHELGVVGLGVMGTNLARNAARNGAAVAIYNRTTEKIDAFVQKYGGEGNIFPEKTLKELVARLDTPRAILLMVEAGSAVDQVIDELLPLLVKGDILIDGGNSHYRDTERRAKRALERGVRSIGMGVSGGEEGALHGPSLMPGGGQSAYKELEPLLQKMAADDGKGGKCVTYLGPLGAGHFVKMVHNGIEYGVMQLIAESYDLLKNLGKFSNAQLAETFAVWNELDQDLHSFLVGITAEIFRKKDPSVDSTGSPQAGKDLIDLVRDKAGEKGTGRWVAEAALEYGIAIPTITAAVEARILSGSTDLRSRVRGKMPEEFDFSEPVPAHEKMRFYVRSALELCTILTYMQGFELLKGASEAEKWNLDLSEVARIWRGGCIIRSSLIEKIQLAYGTDAAKAKVAKEVLLDHFGGERQFHWRHIVDLGTSRAVPLPAMCASLAYFDSLHRGWLPQNLTAAQRDYFGSHGYERVDKKGVFHTEWK